MTKLEFEAMVQRRSKIMTLWTKTTPRLNAEGKKKFPNITKYTRVNGITGYNYENILNTFNAKSDKPDRPVEQRTWGKRDGNLVRHNGKTYVPIRVIRTKTEYKIGDEVVNYEDLKQYLPKKNEGPPIAEYTLDNIFGVTVDGETVKLED